MTIPQEEGQEMQTDVQRRGQKLQVVVALAIGMYSGVGAVGDGAADTSTIPSSGSYLAHPLRTTHFPVSYAQPSSPNTAWLPCSYSYPPRATSRSIPHAQPGGSSTTWPPSAYPDSSCATGNPFSPHAQPGGSSTTWPPSTYPDSSCATGNPYSN